MSGKMSRNKGANFERAMVALAKNAGLEARRTAPNQTQDGSAEFGDIRIAGRKVECKHHATISKMFWNPCGNDRCIKAGAVYWKWLEGHDALMLKRTAKRGETQRCVVVLLPISRIPWQPDLTLKRDGEVYLGRIYLGEYFKILKILQGEDNGKV